MYNSAMKHKPIPEEDDFQATPDSKNNVHQQ